MNVLGICAGAGVLLYPFLLDSRFNVEANLESRSIFFTKHNEQWKANFGDIPCHYDSRVIIDYKPNIIVGAPNCGHSSIFSLSRGKKFSDPKEDKSMTFFIKAINYYTPDLFLMENLNKATDLIDFNEAFKNYKLHFINSSVSKFGNSQVNRKRLVIIGVKKNRSFKLAYPKITHLKTSGELRKGLNKINFESGNIREPYEYSIPCYYKSLRKITVKHAKTLWQTEFSNETRWPVNMERMRNQPGVYRNLDDKYPATARKSNRQFNHVGDQLTPRELARIQGVPDSFKLITKETDTLYWINKARTSVTKCPPYEIGDWFKKLIIRNNDTTRIKQTT